MPDTATETLIVGIVTVSDRASRGEYEDRGGPAIHGYLETVMATPWIALPRVVPDERPQLEVALCELADEAGAGLVLTTGGTGPAKRDVTPEATRAVADREMLGFGEQMRRVSLRAVPTAILSRQTAAIRGKKLIVNLPGQPKAIGECLDAVFPAIPYCIELIGGAWIDTKPKRLAAFRPKSARRSPV